MNINVSFCMIQYTPASRRFRKYYENYRMKGYEGTRIGYNETWPPCPPSFEFMGSLRQRMRASVAVWCRQGEGDLVRSMPSFLRC